MGNIGFSASCHRRVVSSLGILERAEKVVRMIVDTYFSSNKTLPELHASLAHCEAHWHLCYGNGRTSGAA
jgi:hypothetical protein